MNTLCVNVVFLFTLTLIGYTCANRCFPCFCLPYDNENAVYLVCEGDYVDHFPIAMPGFIKEVIIHISLANTYIIRMPTIYKKEYAVLDVFEDHNNILLNCSSLETWYYWHEEAIFNTDCPPPSKPPTPFPISTSTASVTSTVSAPITVEISSSTYSANTTSQGPLTDAPIELLVTLVTSAASCLMLCSFCVWAGFRFCKGKMAVRPRILHEPFTHGDAPMTVFSVGEGSDDEVDDHEV